MTLDRTARITRVGLAWLVTILAAPILSAAGPQIPEDVKSSIRDRVDRGYNAGIVVGMISPEGRTYYTYGSPGKSAQIPKLGEDSVFEIGSISKAFTGILLADMVRKGEVALDDPAQKHLPESIAVPRRQEKKITLLDLATATSGLPRMPSNFAPKDHANPFADYTVEQMYDFLSHYELTRDIGERYEYSNLGMGFLGHILALRAGTSYEELAAARIFRPLGMTSTAITLSPDMRKRLAIGHSGPAEVKNWDIPTLAGAGAIRSTPNDMLTFLAANIGLIETPLHPSMLMSHEPRQKAGADWMHIGLAWHIRSHDGNEIVWHNGGTGGYRAFAGFIAEKKLGVIVLSNSSHGADDIGNHLLAPGLELNSYDQKEVALERPVLARYVGTYQFAPGLVLDVALQDEGLTVQLTGQQALPVFPSSETEFFLKVVPARLTFVTSGEGESLKVESVILHQGGVDQTARRLTDSE